MTRCRSRNAPWTDEDVALLRQFRADRCTFAGIAKHLGRSTASVVMKGRRLGLYGGQYPQRKVMAERGLWMPFDIEFLKDRHHRWGMTSAEITQEMGRKLRSVRKKKVELGLTPNNCGDAAANHIGSKLKGHSATAEIARMEAIAMLEARIAARQR